MYPHRAYLLDVLGLIIGLEQSLADFKVLEIYPYFRHEHATTQNKTGYAVGRVVVSQDLLHPYKTPVLIPDAIVKIRIAGTVRLLAVELHHHTPVSGVIEALRKHSQAMEGQLFHQKFGLQGVNFTLSIHTDPERLRNTIKHIRDGDIPNFDRYIEGFIFGTVQEMVEKGVYDALHHINGKKSPLFCDTQG